MAETTVVNIRRRHQENGGAAPAGVVYIGRRLTMGGWKLTRSEWANPFDVDTPTKKGDGTREDVVALYLTWLHCERPDLLARTGELRGAVLGCWCVPELCHGHVLAALADAG